MFYTVTANFSMSQYSDLVVQSFITPDAANTFALEQQQDFFERVKSEEISYRDGVVLDDEDTEQEYRDGLFYFYGVTSDGEYIVTIKVMKTTFGDAEPQKDTQPYDELRGLVRKLSAELEDATSFMETMEEYAEEHEQNADDEWIRKTSKNNLVKIAERVLNGEVVEEVRCAACLNELPENAKPYEDTEEHFCSQNCLESLYEDAIENYYDKQGMSFNEYLQSEGFEDADDVINREGPAQLEIYSDRYEQQCKECNEIANYN